MDQLIPFVIEHWALSLALVAVLVVIILEERKASGGSLAVTPATAVNLINREKAVVIDLRTEDQFKAGHIVDSIHVPFAELENKIKTLEKYKDRNSLLVCPLNKSASLVMMKVRKLGFTKVQLLAGGIEAWKRADLPVVKS